MTRFGYSSDSSSGSSHASTSSTLTASAPAPASYASSDSGSDSEEEAWPVGPPGSIGINGWNCANSKGKGRARREGRGLGVKAGARDGWEAWEAREKVTTWETANKSFHLSLSRSYSTSPYPDPSLNSPTEDLTEIQSLLSTLALNTAATTAALTATFNARNAALWESIEQSIKAAEAEESDKERARELELVRLRSVERETEARLMREEAEKRDKAEREERGKKEGEERIIEEKKQQVERRRVVAEKARNAAETLATTEGEGSPKFEFEKWTAKMIHIKTNVLPIVSQNPSYRKACFTAKRFITPKIGQLTNSSPLIARILTQISDLLNTLRTPDGTNEEPYIWTLNHLAKSLVRQAEAEVTVSLGTAFPLARVVVGLLCRGHGMFGEVLMARLVKKCFWITGWWPSKRPDQSTADHLKTLGHAPPTSSETLLQYSSRMSGLAALYFAILQTTPLSPPQSHPSSTPSLIPTHFQPSAAWRWLTLILSPPLVALEPTPLLLITFLEIAGESLLEIYGRQFEKVLECLGREGLGEGKAGFSEKGRSSVVRIQLWLEDWRSGKVESAGRRCEV